MRSGQRSLGDFFRTLRNLQIVVRHKKKRDKCKRMRNLIFSFGVENKRLRVVHYARKNDEVVNGTNRRSHVLNRACFIILIVV